MEKVRNFDNGTYATKEVKIVNNIELPVLQIIRTDTFEVINLGEVTHVRYNINHFTFKLRPFNVIMFESLLQYGNNVLRTKNFNSGYVLKMRNYEGKDVLTKFLGDVELNLDIMLECTGYENNVFMFKTIRGK